ncbi:tRNA pseudouridine(38-40) synthase TruA [Shumkonia mesophila]|uniref:tRNA pseudouridine(38-40) synthase TruA n=1 Tax=Shumkonia mesophila TaxID=2838854 RepID=UPI0029348C44|nr:tRNA pseudouridine(38-40) synthase TruA [Shumkonia mesophila]
MPRYRLIVEYDGADFVGWQRQENGLAVQQVIEEAILRFCGERITTFAAGRTDAGVHALGQVVHFDLVREAGPDTVRDAINFHLRPAAVAVRTAERVADDFHARFSAVGRAYLYRIANRRAPLALDRGRAWWVPVPLDAQAMHEAAQGLIGRHDFSSFRAAECQANSPVKTLSAIEVARDGDEIRVTARARSFLHHQVRNMVGTLKRVGEGKWSAGDVARILAARDRAAAGPTAPACGLYLTEVFY